MNYKGYTAKVEFDEYAGVFRGEVIDTMDVITFESRDAKKLKSEFEKSIDEYLKFCAEMNRPPEKPFSGKFMLRVTPDVHREIYKQASESGISINNYLLNVIENSIHPGKHKSKHL